MTTSEHTRQALAGDIMRRHAECEAIRQSAMASMESVIEARMAVARLVETAYSTVGRGRFSAWWRINNLPEGWAGKYMKLAATAGRNVKGDKAQLRLVGLLPEPERGNEGQQRTTDSFAWTKWVAKILQTFTPEFIARMGAIERVSAAKLLEPLVRLHRQLSGQDR